MVPFATDWLAVCQSYKHTDALVQGNRYSNCSNNPYYTESYKTLTTNFPTVHFSNILSGTTNTRTGTFLWGFQANVWKNLFSLQLILQGRPVISLICQNVEVKGKVHPIAFHEGTQREKYCSTLSLTSAARWGTWLTLRPGRFAIGKETRYPSYRSRGGPQGRSGRMQEISPEQAFDSRTVQPVASRYTDYAILVTL